jgi:hypothetical protein
MYSTILMACHLKKYNFELIYMRTRLYMPFIGVALKKHKVVMELNSDDVEEWKSVNKFIYYYNSITRRMFFRLASGYVSVSNEIAERSKHFAKPIVTIANGIKVDSLPYEPDVNNTKPMICFVGSPGFKWHGIDKIEYLATNCPDYDFHIAGEDGKDRGNLKYHGYKPIIELQKIIKNSDVCISTMSLYIKNMNEASPLKSRQYLAQGIPMIYAYEDTDLIGDEEFTLKIPNNESNAVSSLEEIKKFINLCFKDETLRQKAKDFASQNLDVSLKEEKRINFLKTLL